MSQAGLHLIRQRMASGLLARAGRGELAVPLPAGYVRRPSGEAALDPDEQVQAVIRLVFGLFEELGTVHVRAQPHRPVPPAARPRALRPGAPPGRRGVAGAH